MAINRLTVVAPSFPAVEALVDQQLASTLQSYSRPGWSLQQTLEEVALIGTPERVLAQLERYEAAGVSHVFARLSPDELPPEAVRTTIELLGREVIPNLR